MQKIATLAKIQLKKPLSDAHFSLYGLICIETFLQVEVTRFFLLPTINFAYSNHPKPPHLNIIIQGLRFIHVKDVGKERCLEALKTRRRKWCKCTHIKNWMKKPTF